MILNDRQWGSGDRVALLLHGMMGSRESWWRVAPVIAARGYRVVSLDLPGHGRSPRDPNLDVPAVATSVVDTLDRIAPGALELAMGHSFGGTILAAALAQLRPERAILVEAPTSSRGGWDRDELIRDGYEARAARTYETLRIRSGYYSDEDCVVEARAAEQFDPETAAGFSAAAGGDWTPSAPQKTLVVRADPSEYIPDDRAAALVSRGVEVRSIPGARHSVWYSNFDDFMTSIDDWY